MSELLRIENTLFYIVICLYFVAMIFYFLFVALKKDGVAKIAAGIQTPGLLLHT